MIYYKEGYEYVLTRDFLVQTPIIPDYLITRRLFTLYPSGLLEVYAGFAWDGATGVPDFKSTLEAAMVHDVFCQLMNEGTLDYDKYSLQVHNFFGKMCKEGGFWLSGLWVAGVVAAKGGHPSHLNDNPELTAPY